MTISRATAEFLLDQAEENIHFESGERRRRAVQAKKEMSAYLAQLQHTPLRFQFFEHPVHPREIWTFGDVPAEVATPSQIALGLHVLAWAASLPRCYAPLRVIDPTLTPADMGRVRVAVSKARDFISGDCGVTDLATALDKTRVKVHDDATASFSPRPDDPPLILNPA
jgi:hypothetical protein